MLFLAGSIIFTSYLTLSFKVLQRMGISAFPAIVFNYLTCVVTGSLFIGYFPVNREAIQSAWFYPAILMGVLFISIFNLTGYVTRRMGAAITTVPYKLSMVIPFVFAILWYHEHPGWLNISGIILALVAVMLACYTSADRGKEDAIKGSGLLFALLLFISSGLLDTFILFIKKYFFSGPVDHFNDFLVTAFLSAGITGLIFSLFSPASLFGQRLGRPFIAGILIGIPNYFSIWLLGKAIGFYGDHSSRVIPLNNMGIVVFSTLAAVILFSEKLSLANKIGIGLAVGAIALIGYG